MIAQAFHNVLWFLLTLAMVCIVAMAGVFVLAMLINFFRWVFCSLVRLRRVAMKRGFGVEHVEGEQ